MAQNSLESVDEGMVHSEQNVYTEYADPRRTEWFVKIQPALKKGKTKKSRKVMQKQSVAPRDHRTASWAEQTASEDPGITQINSRQARYLIEGEVLGLDSTGNPTYEELGNSPLDQLSTRSVFFT
jgi:hypothetical protein